jgi:AbrB family looped-hinge helix DNA binding protein
VATTAKAFPFTKVTAKMTSKGQITVPAKTRKAMGLKAGDSLTFETTPDGATVIRKANEFPFDRFRGMETGIPELDNGSIEDIVRWFREARGHDEVDDRILGTDRFGTGK